ncbi:MAG: carbamoyl-phosphate synthase (glutamine-hydrolyzing) large subunit, partial [Caldisericia bacterium]|nr:carbamoyl-phosphate synthase (glutamine-hydrolyzing) large subunit [Caldisericia bacterium]
KKVMIIGSGPIIIGQAAEFDYSGTQACKAIKEELIETVLVNSNPATIMTDKHIADKVYIEPITVEVLEKIIEIEKPNGILAGFGGQTALNISMKLEKLGILKKHNVLLLGMNEETIHNSEDREAFKDLMNSIEEPVLTSIVATTVEECLFFAKEHPLPLIVRPAYTLGGTGGGIANTEEELIQICQNGIDKSPISQVLLEKSVAGWKEIEYEVIRDKKNNCIIVCNMENMDPVGVHTGDSIVVAPSQTLTDSQYQMLRRASIKIIRSLNIEGGCNVQFALDPKNDDYIVIEVNPRVSRSSALASKAAGYPIAKISAKISLGYSLDELKNYVTKTSSACFEPSLDYCVVKFPKWPFDKFNTASRKLGTQMKATGEVMAISRTFESALLKAITCLEGKFNGLRMYSLMKITNDLLFYKMKQCDDERIFCIAEAFRRNISIEIIHDKTMIDTWFLNGVKNIVDVQLKLEKNDFSIDLLYEAESMGFTDTEISDLTNIDREQIFRFKKKYNIFPNYKMVDTCAGEFSAETPYFYSSYEKYDETKPSSNKKVLVIGSGPIRIGQGIEFDYCCVQGIWAIQYVGYEAIIVNNNPETVSTDFDIADKLYFEPLYIDDIMNIVRKEDPVGCIVQFGGQTSVNLAAKLDKNGVNILGTSNESIDLAEDRTKFCMFLSKLNIPYPKGDSFHSVDEALENIKEFNYPLVVRPSFVIGGRGMQVVNEEKALVKYLKEAVTITKNNPVLVDRYIDGIEIEVDAISDGEDILIPGIMEHIEHTGVHSGDSITVYPTINLSQSVIDLIFDYTKKISQNLKIKGLVNIQYAWDGNKLYVIEVNPRASRTVPILSKITDTPMIQIAVDIMLGKKLISCGYGVGLKKNKKIFAVKVPVFSSEKLTDVDTFLSPEMKSTGEVLGIDYSFTNALYKAFLATDICIPTKGEIYVSLNSNNIDRGINLIKEYKKLGFTFFSSKGTTENLHENGIESKCIKPDEVLDMISKKKISIIINTPTNGNNQVSNGFKIRRKGVENHIPVFTSIYTAEAFKKAVIKKRENPTYSVKTIREYIKN